MKNITLAILILGLSMPAAFADGQWDSFHDQQMKERKAYRATILDKTPQEREAALRELRAKQREKKKEFKQAVRRENLDILRNRLADNTKLSLSEKEALVDFFQQQYEENDSFKDQAHAQAVVLFGAIASDPGLTMEQKKEELNKVRANEKARTEAQAEAGLDKTK